jgi:pimeloyl-ACP methyl ester carboxylesterase
MTVLTRAHRISVAVRDIGFNRLFWSACGTGGRRGCINMIPVALIAVWLPYAPSPAWAKLDYITRNHGKPLIILVPGTSNNNKSFTAAGSDASLADLMRDDTASFRGERKLADYATATLSFPAGCSDRLSIHQIATGLATDLRDQAVWMYHPYVIFIGYSLGGLVVQEMLSVERDAINGVSLVDRTASVILLATPTNGSELAVSMVNVMEKVLGAMTDCPVVRDLKAIGTNSYLQTLDAQWRRFIARQTSKDGPHGRLQVSCFYETKPTVVGVIVPMDRSAAQCDGERLAISADHFEIAKPSSRDSDIYQRLRGRIAETDLRLKGKGRLDDHRELTPSHPDGIGQINRKSNTFVEGKGYRTLRNTGWGICANLCAADGRCQMIEHHKPDNECNLYGHSRVGGRSRDADVGFKGGVGAEFGPTVGGYSKTTMVRRPHSHSR